MSVEFFGELYLRSTRPFLDANQTSREAGYLAQKLGRLGPVLDLGCGHGRHLAEIKKLRHDVVGVDFDALSLEEGKAHAPVVRGDMFALPFKDEAFWAAYCWYNTLFTFEEAQLRQGLKEIARCVKPGGRFVIQNSNRTKADAQPTASYHGRLPDGSVLGETALFDPATGKDAITRTLTMEDGRVLSASFFIRYYRLDELTALLQEAGFERLWAHGDVDANPLTPESADLIVGAQKRG